MNNPIRVLYVDDNPHDRALVRDALEKEHGGFAVTEAASRAAFEAQLAALDCHLVLTDFNILGFDGLQVLEAVHAKDPQMPVVIVTGTGSEEVAVAAMKRGAADYVLKSPQHIQRLPHTLQAVLETARLAADRKKAEEKIARTAREWQATFDASNDAIWILDSEHRVLRANRTTERIFGRSVEETLGRHCWEMVHGTTEPVPECPFFKSKNTLRRETMQIQIGETWFEITVDPILNASGQYSGAVHVVTDITERKRAEEALRTSEARFRALAEQSITGICLIQDGKFVYVNPRLAEILDFRPEELVGLLLSDLVADEDRDVVRENMRKRLSGEVPYVHYTLHALKKGGARVPLEVHGGVLEYLGRPAIMGTLLDITEREQAEEARQQSERKFRTIFNRASDGMFLCDLETRKFLMCNAMCSELLGFTEEEFIDLDIADLHPPEDVAFIHNQMGEFAKGEHGVRGDIRFRRKDGTTFLADVSPAIVELAGRKSILVAFRDITERKRVEDALRESEERFRTLFETIPGFVFVHRGDRLLDVNAAFERATGYTRDELLNMPFWELVHPDFRDAVKLRGQTRSQGAAPPSLYEAKTLTKSGKERWVVIAASRVVLAGEPAVLGTALDITDLKTAQAAAEQQRQLLLTLIEAMPDYIYVKDVESRFLLDNRAQLRLLGAASQEEAAGKTDADFFPHELAAKYRADEQAVIASGQPLLNREERTRDPEGNDRWLLTTKVPFRDSLGHVIGIVGIGRDITERKRAEEEKAKLEAQLQQAQKMESVGRLAGGVAHDFNNMLGVILGHTEIAMDQVDPAQPLHADLEEIRKAASRSADLTRQLLAFARKQTIAPRVLDLNETVAGTLKMLQRLIGEDIDLNWQPGTDLWPVRVDASQIDQLLANLCVNARDAIADVGKITIETGNTTFDEDYCANHPDVVPGDYVLLAVSDTGCGMDKETLGNIFEPFFTTKGVGEGTGLGLATVYGAVKQNNGFINVYSEPGHGTTFRIYLPRHVGKAEQARTEGAAGPAPGGHETILVVEDEPAVLKLIAILLEAQGYTVLTAATPGEAIHLAREHAGDIHLLMTDVVMPEMNGRDLAKNLLSLYPSVKRLFMSGYTADIIAHHGVLEEGVYFIQKPFSTKDLADKVREALEQS